MREPDVRTTLDAVRRHLWRERARVAARRAAWLSAATLLLAAALHLVVLPIPVDAVLWLVALEWATLLAAAAWGRPGDADCALWIDRHLGGASAFTTLLDPRANAQAAAHAPSLHHLQRWAAARVPGVLRALEAQRPSVRMARSLLALVVCSSLSLFVLSLRDTVPTVTQRASAVPAPAFRETGPASEASVAAELAGEIASALRSTDLPNEPQGRRAGDASTASRTQSDDGTPSAATAARATPLPADASPARPDPRSTASADADASARGGRSAAAVSGRDAGDAADTRADLGVSRAPTGTIAQPRSASTLRGPGGERRADMDQAAGFDEGASPLGGARSGVVVDAPAAAPPRAVAAARLSAIESGYVEAWMKATGRSR